MSSRASKQQVLELCREHDLTPALRVLAAMPAKGVVNALFSLICREDPLLRWRAVTCMGITVARLAEQDLEAARVVMRRFLWSLNDESGGIGWGAPEAMAECMCRDRRLAEEYVHMLISYMREDGEEICQDGNYIEHPMLQRGLLWGVARLSACCPDLLQSKEAEADILPYLHAEDGETRGLAVLASGRLGIDTAQQELVRLTEDPFNFSLYEDGRLTQVTVGQLAQQALEALPA